MKVNATYLLELSDLLQVAAGQLRGEIERGETGSTLENWNAVGLLESASRYLFSAAGWLDENERKYPDKEDRKANIGRPYVPIEIDDYGRAWVECPVCLAQINLVERKDFESFTLAEYDRHFADKHPPEKVND